MFVTHVARPASFGLALASFAAGTLAQTTTPLPTVVVTATARPTPVVDLVSDVEAVDLGSTRARVARSTADLLGSMSGIDLSSNGGPGSTAAVLLRGAGSAQSLTLVDGFRVSSVSLGQTTFEAMPLLLSDRLEVLRGPASGLYGSDAIGGVIQLFTPRAGAAPGALAEVAGGGLGSRRALLGVSGGQGLRAQVRVSREQSDGFNVSRPGSFQFNDDRDGFTRDGALLTLAGNPTPDTDLRAILLQSEVDTDFDDGAFAGARVLARVRLAGVVAEHQMADGSLLTARIGRTTDRSEAISSFPGTYESTQDQASVAASRRVADDVTLRLGFETLRQSLEASTFAGTAPERRTDGYFVSLGGREGAHIVHLSLRHDDSNQFESKTNGSLSYGYVLAGGWRLGGSASTGFRAPSFNDLYYPGFGRESIRPERARSFELGARLDPPEGGDGWTVRLVAYRNRVRDLIVYAPVCPDPAPQYAFGCADNVNQARVQGLSASLGRRDGALRWRVDADLSDPRDLTLDKRLPRRATRQLAASVGWDAGRYRFGAAVKLVGARFDDAANNTRLAGYGLLDLTAAVRIGGDWALFADVTNATDRDYTTAAGYAQQGRVVMVGLRYPAQ